MHHSEGDRIAPYNPLRRVPTLVLECGEALIESTAILDYLDELVGADKAMIAADGPERRHALKVCALATGLGDKAVSLVYGRVLRKDALRL
jgi:glutathione S-transferase